MNRRGLRIGGYVSGGLLIFFGVAVIVLGVWGFAFTRDHIEREGISFGPIEDPAVAEHAPDWAGEPVDTGRKALAQAEIMREHTLSNTGGFAYAEMGSISPLKTRPIRWARTTRRRPHRTRTASRSRQRPQHLGYPNRARDRARHGVHVGDALDLQHHRRHRLAVDRHRPGDPGEGRVRAREDRCTSRVFRPRTRSGDRVGSALATRVSGRCGASSHLSVHQHSSTQRSSRKERPCERFRFGGPRGARRCVRRARCCAHGNELRDGARRAGRQRHDCEDQERRGDDAEAEERRGHGGQARSQLREGLGR